MHSKIKINFSIQFIQLDKRFGTYDLLVNRSFNFIFRQLAGVILYWKVEQIFNYNYHHITIVTLTLTHKYEYEFQINFNGSIYSTARFVRPRHVSRESH